MQVILTEVIKKLGGIGDVVKVKAGYARNYLLPRNKAVRCTSENLKAFENKREQMEAENKKRYEVAIALAEKLGAITVIVARQAAPDGRMYGSVTSKNVMHALKGAHNLEVDHNLIDIDGNIKSIGEYQIPVTLHPDVHCVINLSIVRETV